MASTHIVTEKLLSQLEEDRLRAVAEELEVCLLGVKTMTEMREKIHTLRHGKTVSPGALGLEELQPAEEVEPADDKRKSLFAVASHPTTPVDGTIEGVDSASSVGTATPQDETLFVGALAWSKRAKAADRWKACTKQIRDIRVLQKEIAGNIRTKSRFGSKAMCEVLDANTDRMVAEIDVRERQYEIMRRRLGLPEEDGSKAGGSNAGDSATDEAAASASDNASNLDHRKSSATLLPSLEHSNSMRGSSRYDVQLPSPPHHYRSDSVLLRSDSLRKASAGTALSASSEMKADLSGSFRTAEVSTPEQGLLATPDTSASLTPIRGGISPMVKPRSPSFFPDDRSGSPAPAMKGARASRAGRQSATGTPTRSVSFSQAKEAPSRSGSIRAGPRKSTTSSGSGPPSRKASATASTATAS